ncbi:swi5-like zinc finger protein [Coemansia sp. RSA 2618]|nr:swi5-like zinc finger protein [Coemansia sp. RSA 2618]
MDASPSKRKSSATDISSLVPDSDGNSSDPPFKSTLNDERKHELRAAIESMKGDIETQHELRSALLKDSGLTVDEARRLNDENIERLHRYNDIKDAAQKLFGKLAELKGKTVKDMYEEYGVGVND